MKHFADNLTVHLQLSSTNPVFLCWRSFIVARSQLFKPALCFLARSCCAVLVL